MKRLILAGLLALPDYVAAQTLPTSPPSGFYTAVASNPKGTVANITYGSNYAARVYTPPNYSESREYASMYLMHGMGGSEASWHDNDLYAHIQLDNLLAAGKVKPFIIIFTRNDMNNWNFTSILIDQLIPYIEDHYSVSKDGAHRALGGLSMGGMQTINIGLPNADKFNYLMPSSSAPGIQGQSQLFGDGGTKAKANLKLILFTCGEREVGAYGCNNNNTVRGYCDNVGISDDIIFNWIAPGGAHDRVTWRPSFWNFVQMADQSGFTIGDVSVREYTAGHFSIAAMAGNVGVFDLRGKFLKNISAPEFSTRARDLSPGSYIIQWQSGSHSYTGKYAIGKGYNCIERQ